MALSTLEKDMKIVAKLDDEPNDVGGLSAYELKEKFDEGGEALKDYLNGTLIPELEASGVLAIVRSSDLTALKFLRLNADKVLETSVDGETWTATGSSGHLIFGPDGVALPQRSRMQFANCVVEDNGTVTVVRGVTGPQGATGTQGDQGPQGAKGVQGDMGLAIIPEVDQDTGLMRFKAGVAGAVPSPVYVRGPQGPQGVQGMQGGVGPQGPYGPQGLPGEAGPRGVEGPQGPRGAQGEQGAQGPLGLQGPQGLRGDKGDKGDKGDTGAQGAQGSPGLPGVQGPQGTRGAQGIQGPAGVQGAQGIQGAKGDRGLDGRSFEIEDVYPTLAQLQAAHPSGAVGSYQVSANMELYIWSEANLAWQSIGALEGPQGPMGPQGVQGGIGVEGEAGPQGPQGVQGLKGDVGPQGTTGDKGDKGDTGGKGDTGETGPQGAQGIQGPAGVQGPQGDQGIQGAKGDAGAAGPKGDPTMVNGKSGGNIALTAGDVGAIPYEPVYRTDFNEIVAPGFYSVDNAAYNNSPFGDEYINYFLIVGRCGNGDNVVQVAVNEETGRIKMRLCVNSVWGSWEEFSFDGHTHGAHDFWGGGPFATGTCSTVAATAAKVVGSAYGGFRLMANIVIRVKFTNGNTATIPTLNVEATGAKGIRYGSAAVSPYMITAGMYALLQYDGTYWQLLNPTVGDGTDYAVYRPRNVALVSSAPTSLSNGAVALVYT